MLKEAFLCSASMGVAMYTLNEAWEKDWEKAGNYFDKGSEVESKIEKVNNYAAGVGAMCAPLVKALSAEIITAYVLDCAIEGIKELF